MTKVTRVYSKFSKSQKAEPLCVFQTNHPDDDNEGELVSPYRLMNGRLVRQTKAILAKLRRNILDTAVQNLSSLLRDFTNINSGCQLSFWVSVTWHKHSHSQSREEKCSLQHVLLLPQGLINNNPAKLRHQDVSNLSLHPASASSFLSKAEILMGAFLSLLSYFFQLEWIWSKDNWELLVLSLSMSW